MINYSPVIENLMYDVNYQLDLLRLDGIHPEISGNKWFKLHYNLIEAKKQKKDTLLTFGGAYSNHIAATAKACHVNGLRSIAVIRGERALEMNATLQKAEAEGMHLHFVSRETYSKKSEPTFIEELEKKFGDFYLVPEGGNNTEGILGCSEILPAGFNYDYILCACGTGATFAGLVLSMNPEQVAIGISVLKGNNTLPSELQKTMRNLQTKREICLQGNDALNEDLITHTCITNKYAFSGYAKCDQHLIDFKTDFETNYHVPLDHVYTAKLMYAIFDLMRKRKFKQRSKILAIHTGGLQGNVGFEQRYHLQPMR